MKTILQTTLFLAFSGVMAAAGVGCGYQTSAVASFGEVLGISGVSSGQTTRVSIHSTAAEAVAVYVSFHSAEGCLIKSERVMVGGGKIVIVDLTGYEIAAATGSLRSQVVASAAFEPGPDGTAVTLADVIATMEIFHSGTGDTVSLIRAERIWAAPSAYSEETPGAFSKQTTKDKAPATCSAELQTQETKLKQYYESQLLKTKENSDKMIARLDQESKSKIENLQEKIRELEARVPAPVTGAGPTPGTGRPSAGSGK